MAMDWKLVTAMLLLFGSASPSMAALTGVVTVDASANSVSGGVPASSGQTLLAGDAFSVGGGVGVWNFGPSFATDADGCCFDVTLFGQTFKAGSLVGRVGAEAWFLVGTAGYSGTTTTGGVLGFSMWDGDFANNFGTISAAYSVPGAGSGVPEPAAWAMFIVGFGLISAARRRQQDASRPALA